MEPLLIFGSGGIARRVAFEAERSGRFEVVVFVEDTPSACRIMNKPVVSKTHAMATFDRAEHWSFAVADATHLNQERLALYMSLKLAGFRIASIVSSDAAVSQDLRLRENVFIDATARVLPGSNIGVNAWILNGAQIGSNTKLGSSCWVSSGCVVGDGASLGKNCMLGHGVLVGPGVTLPAWSSIESGRLDESPATTTFVDPLFRAPVFLYTDTGSRQPSAIPRRRREID